MDEVLRRYTVYILFFLGPIPVSNGDTTHQEQNQHDHGNQQAEVGSPVPTSHAPPIFFNPSQFVSQPIQTPNM